MDKELQIGFVLGRDTIISLAEIWAVLDREKLDFEIQYQDKEIFIIRMTDPVIDKFNFSELGGIIKVFEIIGSTDKLSSVPSFVTKNIKPSQTEKRINFGISGYGRFQKNQVYSLGKEIKANYIKEGLSARFVTSRELTLSSVIVTENKLLERGFEVILIKDGNRFIIGKTSAVQNYKSYSKRDYGRPKRDDRNGMLPPKLAQIMINLAQVPKSSIIYDPFCGSGTILQEATLAGYNKVYGSDVSEKQIKDTEENLSWLEQIFSTKKIDKEHFFVADALKVKPGFQADAVIGEGFLGEPVKKTFSVAKEDAKKLAEFYLKTLANLRTIIKSNGKIILAIPFFVVKNEYIYLPLIDKLDEIGLRIESPLPDKFKVKLFGRGNLTYHRPDQFVGREILILKK